MLDSWLTENSWNRLLELLLSREFLWLWCSIIVAWAVFWWVWFLRNAAPLGKAFRHVTIALGDYPTEEDFAQGFQAYREVVEQEPLLARPWREFLESLIFPEEGSGEPIRNTASPSMHLNDSSLIAPQLHTRFFNSVPSHLTGFGILGTFLGLAAGVGLASGTLTAEDPNLVRGALQKLLDGASLAFTTSIFGIFFSLLFLLFERHQVSNLHGRLQNWVAGLEERMRLVTLEALGFRQLHEAEEQSRQLKFFNTDLVVALEAALEDKVASRLAPLLETLIERTEALRQDRSTDSTKVIQAMVADFTSAMNDRTNAEFGSVTAALEAAASKLEAASEKVSGDLAQAGKSASSEIAASFAGFQRGVDRLEGASKSVQGVLEETRLSAEEMTSARQAIHESHAHLQTSLASAKELADSVRQSSTEFARAWNGTRDLVEGAVEAAGVMREQQDRMAAAWNSYQDRFELIDDSLARAFNQMDEALDRYTGKTGEFAKSLDEHTAKAIGGLSSAAGQLNDLLEELTELMQKRPVDA